MARGQILTIPNQTSQLITTLSREQKASLSLLNPNDGICYVKLNGPAGRTVAAWDWKIPSQSYCQLPGPWESLGVYYLDQSGSGRTAEVNVYELDSQIAVPSFIAIGRAVEAAGTTVDISQGSQPANPPASTVRLWVDGSGHLHYLQSNGTDYIAIDNNTLLGSDLAGSYLPNPVIAANAVTATKIANGAVTPAKFSTFDWRPNTVYMGDAYVDRGNSTGVLYFCDGSHYIYRSGPSTFSVSGASGGFSFDGQVNAPSLNASDNIIYFASNSGIWIRWNGGGIQFSHYVMSNGNLYARGGVVYMGGGDNANWQWNGSALQCNVGITMPYASWLLNGDTNRGIYMDNAEMRFVSYPGKFRYWRSNWGGYGDWDLDASGDMTYSTPYGIGGMLYVRRYVLRTFNAGLDGGRSGNEASTYTHTYNAGSHYVVLDSSATSYITRSSKRYKSNVNDFSEEECLARILNPTVKMYSYEHIIEPQHREAHDNRPPDSANPNPSRIGFIAEEMINVVPEACATNTSTGEAEGIAYSELVTLVWGAVRQLNARIDKLEQ
jgi:hypothetical protein